MIDSILFNFCWVRKILFIKIRFIFLMNIKGFRNCVKNSNENEKSKNKIISSEFKKTDLKNIADVEKPLLNKNVDIM